MIPATPSDNRQFSQLFGNVPRVAPTVLNARTPSIASAGISIYSPPSLVNNYLELIARELLLKKDHLSLRQPVVYLRLLGLPFRQFSAEQLTELVFRLCSSYNLVDGSRGERSINLAPADCISDNLALLKGLGFNRMGLWLDATIAGPDRSLEPVRKAIANINAYSGYAICPDIFLSAYTSPDYLEMLVKFLIDCDVAEFRFHCNQYAMAAVNNESLTRATFTNIVTLLTDAAYQVLGDKCFLRSNHQDIALRSRGNLNYGPWGFYSKTVSEWLGLGIGAEGMLGGHLYQNATSSSDYRRLIESGHSPVANWSNNPLDQEQAFAFVQQLYCQHRVAGEFFNQRPDLLKTMIARNWLEKKGSLYNLTNEGILHLTTICHIYNRQQIDKPTD